MADYEPWDAERARGIIAELATLEGATLPILHALQASFGHIHADAIPLIAVALNISRAEVHGCITFYHDFRPAPTGRHVVKLCRAEACQAVGADALHATLLKDLGVAWHGTTSDGGVTVEPVFCLGLCACGPSALVDDAPLARLTAEKLHAALAEAAA
ncbi:MAG TPA: formate dehydrogenase subunit gamma [Acetobacteraceae bacterium]|nr:formate dehydrogenase subunit gamma [Acetobacteraceae bacterium]